MVLQEQKMISLTLVVIFVKLILILVNGEEVQTKDYIKVAMCVDKLNSLGLKDDFCKCGKNVVSCDFSKLKEKNKTFTSAELRAFWPMDDIHRLCICNAPSNVEVILTQYFIYGRWNISRIDIFKMAGKVIIDQAFGVFFAGDMYISKVKFLPTMFSWEYGRGRDRDHYRRVKEKDTAEFKCCSEIKTPKFTSPTFYMEETTVNWIQHRALNNQHPWKNIIFNDVTFNKMESDAIVVNGAEENVSFTNCHFHRMNRTAIAIDVDVSNFLMAHNTFHKTCHEIPFGARSVATTSMMAFIQNRFENQVTLEVDAMQIVFWFNTFNVWNNETFLHIDDTSHGDRIISIEFNTVTHFELEENDIRPLKSYDRIIFNENLIVHCDCDLISQLTVPKTFKNYTQRCYTESGGRKDLCHLKINDVQGDCKGKQKPDYPKLCGRSENNFRSFEYSTMKDVEPFLKSVSVKLKSEFIQNMLQHVKSPFKLPDRKEKSLKSSTTIDESYMKLHLLTIVTIAFILGQ